MNIYALAPVSFGLEAAYHLLMWLASAISPLIGSSGAWLAVVVLTMFVRLALTPVTVSQVKAELARARIAPRLAELQRRYGKDRLRLQQETIALYKDEQASPLAGCLPTLVQIPVLMLLYGLFIQSTIASGSNELLTEPFFDVALGQSLAGLLVTPAGGGAIAVFAVLLIGLAALAELARRRGRVHSATATGGSSTGGSVTGQSMPQFLQWLPYAVLIAAAIVPLAASLYLLVSMAWTAVERPLIRRLLKGGDAGSASPASEAPG